MRTVVAIRYVTALREGGSIPALVEADDGQLYVVKLAGAAQGSRPLVAELIVGELARTIGLRVPELVRVDLDAAFGRTEPHPEIRAVLQASAGLNIGLAYLAGAIAFESATASQVASDVASRIVALDAFAMNVDRTARNPNLLWWRGELWLIDHGAALYWQHGWDGSQDTSQRSFPAIRDHVLLSRALDLEAAAAQLRAVSDDQIAAIVAELPEVWLNGAPVQGYAAHLRARRSAAFLEEAVRARTPAI